jgi:hypothetical protein
MRQSLYAVPKNGTIEMTETAGCAWGYYADGYFDRRPINTSAIGTNGVANTAVSTSTKNAAYIGTLFFNAGNGNRSLFAPAGGYRDPSDGSLGYSGNYGFYCSSSSLGTSGGWYLGFYSGYAYQNNSYRSSGFAVRCVQE